MSWVGKVVGRDWDSWDAIRGSWRSGYERSWVDDWDDCTVAVGGNS